MDGRMIDLPRDRGPRPAMDEADNERMVVDLYCHEAPLVSTPPSAERNGEEDAVHQQQEAVQDHQLEDDESLMAEYMARQRCYAPSRSYLDHLSLSTSSLPDGLSNARSSGVHYIVYVRIPTIFRCSLLILDLIIVIE